MNYSLKEKDYLITFYLFPKSQNSGFLSFPCIQKLILFQFNPPHYDWIRSSKENWFKMAGKDVFCEGWMYDLDFYEKVSAWPYLT